MLDLHRMKRFKLLQPVSAKSPKESDTPTRVSALVSNARRKIGHVPSRVDCGLPNKGLIDAGGEHTRNDQLTLRVCFDRYELGTRYRR